MRAVPLIALMMVSLLALVACSSRDDGAAAASRSDLLPTAVDSPANVSAIPPPPDAPDFAAIARQAEAERLESERRHLPGGVFRPGEPLNISWNTSNFPADANISLYVMETSDSAYGGNVWRFLRATSNRGSAPLSLDGANCTSGCWLYLLAQCDESDVFWGSQNWRACRYFEAHGPILVPAAPTKPAIALACNPMCSFSPDTVTWVSANVPSDAPVSLTLTCGSVTRQSNCPYGGIVQEFNTTNSGNFTVRTPDGLCSMSCSIRISAAGAGEQVSDAAGI